MLDWETSRLRFEARSEEEREGASEFLSIESEFQVPTLQALICNGLDRFLSLISFLTALLISTSGLWVPLHQIMTDRLQVTG